MDFCKVLYWGFLTKYIDGVLTKIMDILLENQL